MKKKGKYISQDIQNELLLIMSHQVLNKLLVLIRDTIFSLICKITLCLRWVTDDLDVFEHFMGFYKIPDIKATTSSPLLRIISLLRIIIL